MAAGNVRGMTIHIEVDDQASPKIRALLAAMDRRAALDAEGLLADILRDARGDEKTCPQCGRTGQIQVKKDVYVKCSMCGGGTVPA